MKVYEKSTGRNSFLYRHKFKIDSSGRECRGYSIYLQKADPGLTPGIPSGPLNIYLSPEVLPERKTQEQLPGNCLSIAECGPKPK